MKKSSFMLYIAFMCIVLLVMRDNISLPYSIAGDIRNTHSTWQSTTDDAVINDLYHVGFPLSKKPIGTINTYLPVFQENNQEMAAYYMGLFDFDPKSMIETDDYFCVTDARGSLQVDKYQDKIFYESSRKHVNAEKECTDLQALANALTFMDNSFLFLNYEEAEVSYNDGLFNVRFIGRIANIKSYAFNTRVVLDASGEVLIMEYYNEHYEKYGDCKIKSMEQAFYELPIDFLAETQIYLTQCSLVYVYEDSIIQPAYLFEGTLQDAQTAKTFKSFVKAAVYDS